MQYRLVDIVEIEKMVDVGIEMGRKISRKARLYDKENNKMVDGTIEEYEIDYETVGIDPILVDEFPVLEMVLKVYDNGTERRIKYRIRGVTEEYRKLIEEIVGKRI